MMKPNEPIEDAKESFRFNTLLRISGTAIISLK